MNRYKVVEAAYTVVDTQVNRTVVAVDPCGNLSDRDAMSLAYDVCDALNLYDTEIVQVVDSLGDDAGEHVFGGTGIDPVKAEKDRRLVEPVPLTDCPPKWFIVGFWVYLVGFCVLLGTWVYQTWYGSVVP